MDCLFCKIVAGQIPVERIYEDEHVLAFPDIHPQAPVHVLIVPKQHFASIADVTEGAMVGNLMAAAVKVAGQKGIGLRKDGGGYRLPSHGLAARLEGSSMFRLMPSFGRIPKRTG
jgi:histidine triad (HIT) family protein